jgi:hypothetical protein
VPYAARVERLAALADHIVAGDPGGFVDDDDSRIVEVGVFGHQYPITAARSWW